MSVENLKLKQAIIDEIKDKLNKAESAVVIDYLGTTVEQANAMRRKLREANVDYTVYKNTMMARAIAGTQYESLKNVLEGPSAIAISYDDAIAPARVLAGVMKEYNKMAFKAGVVEGVFYDAEGVKELSAIPSRNELIAKFMGSIQSPVGKFVRTLQAVADAKPQTGDAIAPAAAQEPAEAVQETEAPAEAEAPAAE
ncbi:MAG: 50S ribosomal protein L10 [Eubacteriales bacterium]|nr:50S ribosomal protein L10 [Eubacteriales bacterium]MDD3864111.1 50S ribosomal protein L10 [Eubacteriales bacterium]